MAINHVKYEMVKPEIPKLVMWAAISILFVVGLILSGPEDAEFTLKCSFLLEVNTLPPCTVMCS